MYKLKYDTAFCRKLGKEIKISYIHIVEKDLLVNDGFACAEAKIHKTCLEKDSCLEVDCSQNNFFGEEYMQEKWTEP